MKKIWFKVNATPCNERGNLAVLEHFVNVNVRNYKD